MTWGLFNSEGLVRGNLSRLEASESAQRMAGTYHAKICPVCKNEDKQYCEIRGCESK